MFYFIFRQVVIIVHSQVSEAFSRLEISTPQAKDRYYFLGFMWTLNMILFMFFP